MVVVVGLCLGSLSYVCLLLLVSVCCCWLVCVFVQLHVLWFRCGICVGLCMVVLWFWCLLCVFVFVGVGCV